MAWAGWGAGPAGAGAAGGPSKVFLGLALALAVVVGAVLLGRHQYWQGAAALCAAAYFGLRLAGVLGGRRKEHP